MLPFGNLPFSNILISELTFNLNITFLGWRIVWFYSIAMNQDFKLLKKLSSPFFIWWYEFLFRDNETL